MVVLAMLGLTTPHEVSPFQLKNERTIDFVLGKRTLLPRLKYPLSLPLKHSFLNSIVPTRLSL